MKNYCLPIIYMIKLLIGRIYHSVGDLGWDLQEKEGEAWFGGISGFWRC